MSDKATIIVGDHKMEYPVITGTEHEKAIDVRKLRSDTGYITYDEGYGNTGSCQSDITFIDGEKGILRYRGYPIEQLAENSTFIECAHLIIYGNLPKRREMREFSGRVLRNASVHEGMRHLFEGFPTESHPMAILSALLNSLGCYYPHMASNDREQDLVRFDEAVAVALSKVRTIAAMAYRMKNGMPFVYPRHDLGYSQNFLHMMFSEPYHEYYPHDDVTKALDLFFLLHADHEQNCSTSTVRMVASGGANLFASLSAGISALWGPLHGGANMRVIEMLQQIHADGDDGTRFIEAATRGEAKLMGFGHRVYKNYDPRAKILRASYEKVLKTQAKRDPLMDIAQRLEEKALSDSYFIDRKLYPNVDFYSGLILNTIGLPLDMFTVMFAIGRMPGWIANWKELADSGARIHRPRQIYTGSQEREYVRMRNREGVAAPQSPEEEEAERSPAENAQMRA
ncbi:MAG: citrate synthase [Opitutales bacterium]